MALTVGAILLPEPSFPQAHSEKHDSVRTAIADSIARDAAPRRIRGTVINRSAEFPISHAEIFLVSPALPAGTFLHATADRAGRFEIRNPPVGPFIIGAQCSGSGLSEEKVVAAGGFYLRPGTDTAIALVAHNVRRCFKADRMFPLQSGWLESTSATDAAAPTADEARVYAAAISYLRNQKGQRIVAVANHTIATCRLSARCGRVQLPRLVQEGVVDTSTQAAFARRQGTGELLNPAFARELRLHVMTDEEMNYLAHEADPRYGPMDELDNEPALFWVGFHKLYGPRARMVSLTRASFNKTHAEALLEVRVDSTTPNWNGLPSMFLLRRNGRGWLVVNDDLGRGETSGRLADGRCLARSASASVGKRDIDALAGDFDITLIGVAESEFKRVMRVRIAGNTAPIWEGYGSPRPPDLQPIRHSFEVLRPSGEVDSAATSVLSIDGISRNIARNPRMVILDGPYDHLIIKHITNAGFSGSYVGGVYGDSNFGYFCAAKVTSSDSAAAHPSMK